MATDLHPRNLEFAMPVLTKDLLNRLWPNCEARQPGLIDGIVAQHEIPMLPSRYGWLALEAGR